MKKAGDDHVGCIHSSHLLLECYYPGDAGYLLVLAFLVLSDLKMVDFAGYRDPELMLIKTTQVEIRVLNRLQNKVDIVGLLPAMYAKRLSFSGSWVSILGIRVTECSTREDWHPCKTRCCSSPLMGPLAPLLPLALLPFLLLPHQAPD